VYERLDDGFCSGIKDMVLRTVSLSCNKLLEHLLHDNDTDFLLSVGSQNLGTISFLCQRAD